MAIEAGHINPNHPFFPSHFPTADTELIMNHELAGPTFHGTHVYMGTPTEDILPLPTAVMPEPAFPSLLYQPTSAVDLFFPGKASVKEAADSGLTYNNNNNNNNSMAFTSSRKRFREYYSMPNDSGAVSQRPRLSSLLEHEAAIQIQQQQREFDCLIAQHMQRLKMEAEERTKQRSKVVSAVREAVEAKLREKDEEIERLAKLNWALQERIRNLCVENELWRGLAQSNEATVNSLRTDLERALTSTGAVEDRKPPAEDDDDDAESCCGSSDGVQNGASADDDGDGVATGRRGCKGCGGMKEAGVLVMPCRHLCLCTTCGSSRQSCPVCGSAITTSVHVNFSSY